MAQWEQTSEGKAYKAQWAKDNRERLRIYHAEWRKRNPDKLKATQAKRRKLYKSQDELLKRYGMTNDDYEVLLVRQRGACAVCGSWDSLGKSSRFHVDHDHCNNRIRGLTCALCNAMLGQGRDKPEILRAGADYLEKHNVHR
jgi:hypothetical protein